MYRDTVRSIDDLHAHEQLALGGLLRVLIRLDGRFTPAEEAQLARVGEELGGADDLRAVLARSAEVLADDAAIRDVARQVERPEARLLIREALEAVARADTIHPAEQSLLDWCDELWGPRAAP